MGPLELLYIAIGIFFLLITLVRGYQREIATTLLLMITIFLITFLEQQTGITERLASLTTGILSGTRFGDTNVFLSFLWTTLFIALIFAGYAGLHTANVLRLGTRRAELPLGFLLDLAIGMLNGYLVAGMLWYFQDKYGYPLQQFVRLDLTGLSDTARQLIAILPPRLIDNPVYWIIPVVLILLWQVRG
jgi:hypothetical protein